MKHMNHFSFKDDALHIENISLKQIAKTHGTPAYVYSYDAIESEYSQYANALKNSDCDEFAINYAVKANSNLAILQCLHRLGAGFDLVSIGELHRVLAAGGQAKQCIFSGVGKTSDEIFEALTLGIGCFNVESTAELENIARIAKSMDKVANISIRVNPNIDAKTHPYISTGLKDNKFGISHDQIIEVYQQANAYEHIHIKGIACHIGSQITDLTPFRDSVHVLMDLVDRLSEEGIHLSYVDVGGGLGIAYQDEIPPNVNDYIDVVSSVVAERSQQAGRNMGIHIEPGRRLIGNAGVLLTDVIYTKTQGKNFAIVDVAMNDILRPMLYQGWHRVMNVDAKSSEQEKVYEIVGPICESTDTIAHERMLSLKEGDTLAIFSAGAYCMAMSSNYNARKRPVELLVKDGTVNVIRSRDTVEQIYLNEKILP